MIILYAFIGVLVALRKESVDRNSTMQIVIIVVDTVALRKESVDRNLVVVGFLITLGGSLSARRAWIEIGGSPSYRPLPRRRSPQGERG